MDTDKLKDALLFFSKFEYALTRAGYTKLGRKINNNSSEKTVEADWDTFIKKLPEDFFKQISKTPDYHELYKDDGPKVWGKNKDNNTPQFLKDTPITDNSTLIYACKHVRNNLIHGEKLQSDQKNVGRNHKLLQQTRDVLLKALEEIPAIDSKEKAIAIFDDIPF